MDTRDRMPRFIYNTEDLQDAANVLQYINDFIVGLGLEGALLNSNKIYSIIKGAKMDFPHNDGIDKASTFKKVAHFLCYFVAERPLPEPFPEAIIGKKMAKVDNHQNALLGFMMALDALENSTVLKKDADGNEIPYEIKSRVELSQHSYFDIIDALASATPSTSFKLVTVLLEQLVYKTNSDCQYGN